MRSAEASGSETAKVPAVSWLVCTHVANEFLRLALESCLGQTFDDFELVVVANGPDNAEIVSTVHDWFGAEPRVRVIGTEVHHLNFSLNLGLHFCRAELIARMDSDDLSSPNRLALQVAFMNDHPDVVVLGTNYVVVDPLGRACRTVSLPGSDAQIRRAMFWRNPLCHPSVMFRRAAVLELGGYLGGIHAEDYDLWCRIALDKENRFCNLSETCLSYRNAGIGTARRSRYAYASMAAAQWRNLVLGAGGMWAIATLATTLKAIIRSNRPSELR